MRIRPYSPVLLLVAASVVLTLVGPVSQAHARVETLRWISSEPEPVDGFRVHHGSAQGVYGTTIDVGLPTPDGEGVYSWDLDVPDAATVFVALTAYQGVEESVYSNSLTLAPVVDEPTALDDGYGVEPNGVLAVNVAGGVLANDSDQQGDALTAVLESGPTDGNLFLNPNGSFTYTPDPGFTGTDAFTYRANDGAYVSTVATVTISVYSVVSNLQAHWRFDEGAGALSNDSSGSGHTGSIAGASWTADEPSGSGYALSFDGLSDYVDVGGVDIAGQALTISMWLKADSFGVTDARMLSKATGTAETDHYWMLSTSEPGSPKLRFRLKAGGTTSTLVASGGELAVGVWTHVAAIYDGATMRLYKDGAQVGSLPKSGALAVDASVRAAIGNQPAGAGNKPFHGSIDDVRIYDRVLTGTELVALSMASDPGSGAAPTAVADTYTMDQDTVLAVNSSAGVLANDSDPESDRMTAVLVTNPGSGTLRLNGNGSFEYTPNAGFVGTDGFAYQTSDGNLASEIANVTLTVRPNLAPNGTILTPNTFVTLETGDSASFTGSGTDPDGDVPLTYRWDFANSGVLPSTSQNPGTVTFNKVGTYPVTLTVSDSRGKQDPTPATVIVTVKVGNRAPEGSIDSPSGAVGILAGQSVSFSGTGTDPDGDSALTYWWDFAGSGVSPSTAEDPGTVTFPIAGTYLVSLTVTDSSGKADATPATVTVRVLEPSASFRDVTVAAGVDYLQYEITEPPSESDADYMTGGAAAGDYDGDGWVDLYVTELDAMDILFRNRGDGTFEDVTAQAGLDLDLGSNGAAWGDVDNDGDLDLYVTTLGPGETRFYLFINNGRGRFNEQALTRGAAISGADSHYGYSITFGDYDLDGWLDIHTTEWRPDADNPSGADSNARLLRNRGSERPGFFEDVTVAANLSLDDVTSGVDGGFSFTSQFADMDQDGWPDLVVSGDFGTSRLFWNNRNGTFTDGTDAAGVGTDQNGVGGAIGDFDGDTHLDWFVSSIFDPDDTGTSGNRLYRNNRGDGTFSDETDAVGVRDGYWGAGSAFLDFDNDGDLDLVATNGANVPYLDPPEDEPFARFLQDPTQLWQNDGSGVMTEVAAGMGIVDDGPGRGLLTFDFDNDGDLDIFIVNNAGNPVLYRNDVGNMNSWLRVDVEGTDSNRDGIGAVASVWVERGGAPIVHEIGTGSHFLGQSDSVAHFGLGRGSAPIDRVEVYWPATDRTNVFTNVSRNTTLAAVEPSAGAAAERGSGGGGAACGLIGIEPFLLLPFLRRRRARNLALSQSA